MTMPWRKGKTSGWAAFDRAHRHKEVGEPEAKAEKFPSTLSSMGQMQNFFGGTNGGVALEKPFATVLQGPVNIQSSGTYYDMGKNALQNGRSNMSDHVHVQNGPGDVLKNYDMLKKLHPWADQSLIEGFLTGVDNDVFKASTLLNMVSSENNYEENPLTVTEELKSSSMGQMQNFFGGSNGGVALEKPFVTVLQGPVNILASGTHYDMSKNALQNGRSDMSDLVNEQNGPGDVLKKYDMLKKLHPWADQSLIEVFLTGVDNDVFKASTLLKNMVSSENNYEENPPIVTEELKSNFKGSSLHKNKSSVDEAMDLTELNFLDSLLHENNSSVGKGRDLTELNCLEALKVDNEEFQNEKASSKEMYVRNNLHADTNPKFSKYAPIEPEWEEDDFYLVHRKDALRMTRLASKHSKAARDAYLRGDHLSAQFYSQKACEEWIIAEKLNARAANEILAIRNSKNDEWTLDLHGLHVSEAVKALQAHLQKIESRIPVKQFMFGNGVNVRPASVLSIPPGSASCSSSENLSYQIPSLGPRPTSLQVITGKGNHSRGKAAIPAAIRSFLTENGYRYDESRPGVIDVKPKFRR